VYAAAVRRAVASIRMKRSGDHGSDHDQGKKHKSEHHNNHKHRKEHSKQERPKESYEDALAQLPPATSKSGTIHIHPIFEAHESAMKLLQELHVLLQSRERAKPSCAIGEVPGFVSFSVPSSFPALPSITDPDLASAPFKHGSTAHNRNNSHGKPTVTYERLELLGDAYIELIASRLLYERFGHLPAGQQSQLRELLVKNETLAEYSRAYGFDKQVKVASLEIMVEEARGKGNKGFNKVLGDVFEAYLAAVIVADSENGFAIAEKWLTALWAPKLLAAARYDRSNVVRPDVSLNHHDDADPRTVYNPAAKADLQKRILSHAVTLSYERYKDTVELKGDQLGQNRHFIALYLTGYGYERKVLGKGEGKSKVEAGNWAATEAMFGEAKGIVDECEEKLKEMKAKKAEERAAKGRGR
jgi:ribonuclease-3